MEGSITQTREIVKNYFESFFLHSAKWSQSRELGEKKDLAQNQVVFVQPRWD